MEVSKSKLCLGEGATVIDPWLESRAEEAALRASRWSEASRAYAEAQEKRRKGHKESGGTLVRSRSSPLAPALIPQDAIPIVPQIEEEAVRVPKESTDPSAGCARVIEGTALGASSPTCSASGGVAKRRTRPRGSKKWRRGKEEGEGEVEIWTFNSSGAPQLRAAIEHVASIKGRKPVAVLSQEHHACVQRLLDLQAQVRQQGWRLAAVEAVVTGAGGRSSGVGVCTPAHSALGTREGEAWNWPIDGSAGRAVAGWVQQLVQCGIYLASCYLHDTEGGSERNLELVV